jgi:predicted RNA-binding protein
MNYWLFVTTQANWKVSRENNIVGVAERHKNALSKVHLGDKSLFYIKAIYSAKDVGEPPLVSGAYEVISDIYYDSRRIFSSPSDMSEETFPWRLQLNCLTPSSEPIAFKPLIEKLSFIKNKKHWGGTLQGNALLNIPEQDFRTIVSSL